MFFIPWGLFARNFPFAQTESTPETALLWLLGIVFLLFLLGIILAASRSKLRQIQNQLDRSKAELRNSQRLLEAAQARAQLGFWEYYPATKTGVWSAEMYRMFDCDPALGPPTMEEFFEMIHPEDRHLMILTPVEGPIQKNVHRVDLRSNPERGPVRYFNAAVEFIRTGSNGSFYMAGTTMEITERKRAEEILRDSEERWRTVVENVPDFIARLDRTGRILTINRVAPGLTLEQILGTNGLDFLTEEYQWIGKQCLHQVFEKGEAAVLEARALVPPSDQRWFLTRLTPIRKDGIITSALMVSTDITERKKAEQQILTSLHEKEALLKEIHHRVKNNLQIITSLLNLQAAQLDNQEVASFFNETKNRIRSMALLHEILYQTENLAQVHLPKYIVDVCQQLMRSFGVDEQRIHLRMEVSQSRLELDRAIPCGLLITELVSNSLKYAFPENRGGTIRVELHPTREGYCTLIIADDGVGLPAGMDFRSTSSLGLRLVCDLSQQIRGDISVQTDQGTTFTISFPA